MAKLSRAERTKLENRLHRLLTRDPVDFKTVAGLKRNIAAINKVATLLNEPEYIVTEELKQETLGDRDWETCQ